MSNFQLQFQQLFDENGVFIEEVKKLEKTQEETNNLMNQLIDNNNILINENKSLISKNKKLNKILETDIGTSTSVIQHDQDLIQLKKYLTDNQIDITTLIKQLKQRFYWQLLLTVKIVVEASHTVHIWANCSFKNRQYHCIIQDERYFFFILELILFILLFKILVDLLKTIVINTYRLITIIITKAKVCCFNCFQYCSKLNCCLLFILLLIILFFSTYWGIMNYLSRTSKKKMLWPKEY
jgi:hypothetical protein